ncbi:hypothetical protein DMENIID0001_037630 [Sergentomyia squamirostris]
MGVRADPGSFRWCQALSRSRSIATTRSLHEWTLLCLFLLTLVGGIASNTNLAQQDAVHITAILGESVVFNCHVEFPGDHPVPYVLQWEKKVSETKKRFKWRGSASAAKVGAEVASNRDYQLHQYQSRRKSRRKKEEYGQVKIRPNKQAEADRQFRYQTEESNTDQKKKRGKGYRH